MPQYVLEALPFDKSALPSVKTIESRLLKATESIRRDVIKDFRRTVDSWEHRVNFRSRISTAGGNVTLYVYTPDLIYMYVNYGTSPHPITATRSLRLHVRLNYVPKTSPGRLDSGTSKYMGPTVWPTMVMHRGSRGRRFNDVIAEKNRDRIREAFRVALTDMAR